MFTYPAHSGIIIINDGITIRYILDIAVNTLYTTLFNIGYSSPSVNNSRNKVAAEPKRYTYKYLYAMKQI